MTEYDKGLQDLLLYGTCFMQNGKHIPLEKTLMSPLTHPIPMGILRSQPNFEAWMDGYVWYDPFDKAYVGYVNLDDEICRDKDPTIFLLLLKEALNEREEE